MASLSKINLGLLWACVAGTASGTVWTFNNIAWIYDAQGRYPEALTTYEKTLAIRRELGDRAGEGITLNNLGLVYLQIKDFSKARENFEAACRIFERLRGEVRIRSESFLAASFNLS